MHTSVFRSVKNTSKRIFIFTNQEDPFDDCDPEFRKDMRRTTIQRARVSLNFRLCSAESCSQLKNFSSSVSVKKYSELRMFCVGCSRFGNFN